MRERVSAKLLLIGLLIAAMALLSGCVPTKVGTFTPRVVDGTVNYSPEGVATEAKAVKVKYARVQQVVGQPQVPEIGTLRAAGISSQIVVKSPVFGKLPPDIDAYQRDLGSLLDGYRTPLVAVQNEETVPKFWLDTPDNYLRLLSAATDVAKAKGIPITNGGIDRLPIALATWNHLRLTRGTAYADKFLDDVFDSSAVLRAQLHGVPASDSNPYSRVATDTADRWKEGEYLLSHYGTNPGDVPIDYVNFHWYVSDNTAEGFRSGGDYTDTQALSDVVTSIREMTGKQAVTNEIGQWGTSTQAPLAFLGLLCNQLQVPFVIWFDADGDPAHGLHESGQPGVLRDNGRAFAAFVDEFNSASASGR